jgi:ABC-type transport system involved in multi-copper enzyme maturation permease subunit
VITQGASTGFAPVLVAYLMGLIGVFTFGHEYRHGMIRATLTAVPRRWTVLGAKALVVLGWALVVSVLCLALGVLAGQITLRGVGFSVTGGDLPRVMAGFVVYVCLFTLVGLAIAALGLLLLIPLVVENVLRLVITLPDAFNDVEGVVRYFPFDAGSRMLVLFPLNAGEVFGPIPLGPLMGGVTFAVFTVVVLALGGLLFVRRDA